jgi:hypothetical protein
LCTWATQLHKGVKATLVSKSRARKIIISVLA